MTAPAATRLPTPLADPRFRSLVWLVLGVVGWAGIVMLSAGLQANGELGFDLELILEAGRRVAAGHSPYDPAVVAGAALEAQDLFYSYPPPLGQAAAIVSVVPLTVALVAFGVAALATFVAVIRAIVGRLAAGTPGVAVALPVVAVIPFLFPMAVALLFGNVDAWYPALYGAMLLGALPTSSRGMLIVGGVALAIATLAKIHPASMALWFVVRALRDPSARVVLASAVAVGLGAVAVSLAVGGTGPWQDYIAVIRTVSGADLVLRNNIGPAAQVAALVGAGEAGARLLHLPIVAIALAATAWAAWRVGDAISGLAVAAAASLVVLPVTWYHYPVALLPFAIAAWARGGPGVGPLLALAAGVAAVSIVLPVSVWASVALVLGAVWRSGRSSS